MKVQFHWDREGQSDEGVQLLLDPRKRGFRPAQGGAGSTLHRIRQEVIVDFLEGDPDRPIITGRVYNADNMPPYPL